MANDKENIMIDIESTLFDKVKLSKGDVIISDDVINAAEELIADMSGMYLDWVKEDFTKLDKAMQDLTEKRDKASMRAVFEVAHDMKGQGGSFGYDLITTVGGSLCRFIEVLEKKGTCDDMALSAVRVHVDTMKLVINNRIKGDGGAMGKQLISGIEAVKRKLTP